MNFKKTQILFFAVLTITLGFVIFTFLTRIIPSKNIKIGEIPYYNLEEPTEVLELPGELLELSGLTSVSNNQVACVQDEMGKVYIVDLATGDITRRIDFGKPGDYEDIARVNNDLYVLRSDGKIFEIKNYASEQPVVNDYNPDIAIKNNEGLAYDEFRNQLLIGGKSEPKGKEYEDQRHVLAFDLTTKKLKKEPVFVFEEKKIEEFVLERGNLPRGTESEIKIHPAALLLLPDEHLLVLSSKDYLIYVYDQSGTLRAIRRLDAATFRQAEGIALLENGDLLVANEGWAGGSPTILRFARRAEAYLNTEE